MRIRSVHYIAFIMLLVYCLIGCNSAVFDDLGSCPQGVYFQFYRQTPCEQFPGYPSDIREVRVFVFDDEDLLENYNDVTAEILMKGDNVEINGQGVVYSNNIISVTNGGTFIFSGNLNDGQIYINNEELTHIIFNGCLLYTSDAADE